MRDEQAEMAQQEEASNASRHISEVSNLGIPEFRQHGDQIARIARESV